MKFTTLNRLVLYMSLIFLGLVLGFLISVLSDRLVGKYLYKTGYFKALKPNTVEVYESDEFSYIATISAQGLRNEEVKIPKPAGTYRILALGDSFTFGWGVDLKDSWVKLFESDLRKNGENIEVINAGIPGLDPQDEVDICHVYADYFQADAFILGLYSTEDLYGLVAMQKDASWESQLLTTLWPTLTRLSNPILFGKYNDLDQKVLYSKDMWPAQAAALLRIYPNLVRSISPEILSSFFHGRINPVIMQMSAEDPRYYLAMLDTDDFKNALNLLDDGFSQLKSCAGKRPVIIVLLPTQSLVNREFFHYMHDLGFESDDRLLSFNLDTPISALSQKHGFYYVSLLSDFRKSGCLDCYYKWDSHLTDLGNQLVAGKLSPWVNNYFLHKLKS